MPGVIMLIACLLAAPPVSAQIIDLSAGSWVDLSHDYSSETLYWPTADGFTKETVFEGHTDGGWFYTAYNICTAEHGGTHIDAPIHFAEEGQTVDQISLDRLIANAVVIDISEASQANPDYQATREDLEHWEAEHGQIPAGAAVLFRTGFASRWPNADSYMGTAEKGAQAVARLHFPGIHPEAARFLVRERGVASVGIDTPSIDYGQSQDFVTHRIL
ncbi:MAG: cyclase family protein, partial [Saprospiraceae bacterium]|nr:cyclase family protein [Saprospiraceae bacterium]